MRGTVFLRHDYPPMKTSKNPPLEEKQVKEIKVEKSMVGAGVHATKH